MALFSTVSCCYFYTRLDEVEDRLTHLIVNNTSLQQSQENVNSAQRLLRLVDTRLDEPLLSRSQTTPPKPNNCSQSEEPEQRRECVTACSEQPA